MKDQGKMVALGKLGRPKGLKGDLYFDSYNEDSEYLRVGAEVFLDSKRGAQKIEFLSPQSKRQVIHLAAIDSRDEAETLTGKEIAVPREWLPELKKGEYYVADLVGCEVLDSGGKVLGQLEEVIDAPGNQIYVVSLGEEERLIPILEGVLESVDLEARQIKLNPPEEINAF